MTGEQENKIIAAIAATMAGAVTAAGGKMDSAAILAQATDAFHGTIDNVISDYGYDRYNDGMAAEREVHFG